MTPAEQHALQVMQNALGGMGLFGQIPQGFNLPPGSSAFSGSPYSPQIPIAPKLNFGGGIGSLASPLISQMAANRGYIYAPPAYGLYDAFSGRAFEREYAAANRMGIDYDTQNIARAVQRIMTPQFGAAYAGAFAQTVAPTAAYAGMANYIVPGGSAADFSRQMFMASTMLQNYAGGDGSIGLPAFEARKLTAGMLNTYAPGGRIDHRLMRTLSFSDTGALATRLAGSGLLDASVSAREVSDFAGKEGLNISGADFRSTVGGFARADKLVDQLKKYADITKVMRQIMGNPNAPVDQILDNLQMITGGTMQQHDPIKLQNMLFSLQSTSRATGLSTGQLGAAALSGSMDFASRGMNSFAGAQAGMFASQLTATSQLTVNGAFAGRFLPENERQIRYENIQRGVTSNAAMLNVNVNKILDTISYSQLDPTQKTEYDQLRQRAQNMEFRFGSEGQILGGLNRLGRTAESVLPMLYNTRGVDKYMGENPQLMSAITAAQNAEARGVVTNLSGVTLNRLGANDSIRKAIEAAGPGKYEDNVKKLISTLMTTGTGSAGEFYEAAKAGGLNLGSAENADAIIKLIEGTNSRVMQSYKADNMAEFVQLYGSKREDATKKQMEIINKTTKARAFLNDLVPSAAGNTTLQRFVGELTDRPGDWVGAGRRALGFINEEDLKRALPETSRQRIAELMNKSSRTDSETGELKTLLDQASTGLAAFKNADVDTATKLAEVGKSIALGNAVIDDDTVNMVLGAVGPEERELVANQFKDLNLSLLTATDQDEYLRLLSMTGPRTEEQEARFGTLVGKIVSPHSAPLISTINEIISRGAAPKTSSKTDRISSFGDVVRARREYDAAVSSGDQDKINSAAAKLRKLEARAVDSGAFTVDKDGKAQFNEEVITDTLALTKGVMTPEDTRRYIEAMERAGVAVAGAITDPNASQLTVSEDAIATEEITNRAKYDLPDNAPAWMKYKDVNLTLLNDNPETRRKVSQYKSLINVLSDTSSVDRKEIYDRIKKLSAFGDVEDLIKTGLEAGMDTDAMATIKGVLGSSSYEGFIAAQKEEKPAKADDKTGAATASLDLKIKDPSTGQEIGNKVIVLEVSQTKVSPGSEAAGAIKT